MATKSSTETARKIRLPLSEAFRISLESIRVRLSRAAITAASIALGKAFFTYLIMLAALTNVNMVADS